MTPPRPTFQPRASRVRFAVLFCAAALLAVAATAPRAASPDVVISQVYGGGGNTNAPLRNDFVELFNRGSAPVSLTGWSVQYASATGTGAFNANPVIALSGTLAPGQYYLVQMASGGAAGALLPAANASGSTNMSATGGKVALVNNATGLSCNGGSLPCSALQLAQMIDLVGWDGANFFEGAAAPTTSALTAVFRNGGGCVETDNNFNDFTAAAPSPRNTASPTSPCVTDVPPVISSTVPASGAASVALAANIVVTFSEAVTAPPSAFALTCTTSGAHTVAVSGGPVVFTVDPDSNFASGEACTLTVRKDEVVDQDGTPTPMAVDGTLTFTTVEVCGAPAIRIHQIQGSGLVSAMAGSTAAVEAIVTATLQGPGQFGGFFVQEEDGEADGDPATSEGVFVFSSVPVAVGDRVRVRGTVVEFVSSGTPLTELSSVSSVLSCATSQALPAVSVVTLPVASPATFERYEGMRVSIPQTLTVTETFTLARFGELELSANGRLPQPTNVALPGAPAAAVQALNDRSRIVLDDANNQQNIDPTLYPQGGLSAANTARVGDSVMGVAGILEQRFGVYRVQPTAPVVFDHANPRPAAPVRAGGTMRVASFNVLNYFNGNGLGSGFPTPRGATTLAEFNRQRAKTIAAITAIDADVIGLMELENDATGNSAIEDLVAGLNAATAPGTYAFIDTGIVGTDEIRVALLYKPASVVPYHTYALMSSAVNPDFIDTLNRPSLAQTFTQISNGKRLTVVVNHLKSKGSDCADVNDPDTGDGQGNCNVTRTKAATALMQWDPLESTCRHASLSIL